MGGFINTAVFVFSGFLESGKTTAIQNILLNKTSDEKIVIICTEKGEINYEDLTQLTKFIKEDIGDIDRFKKRLEDMSEYEDIDNIKENIDSIVSIVFG